MAATSKNINVNLVGKGKLVLRPANYMTTGGEASIYRVGDTIVKVYTDPAKMAVDKMVEKVELLSKIRHKFIINPLGAVEDEKHNPIGYFMNFSDHEAMSRVFTTAFRLRDGFTDQDAITLVHNMREVPVIAHTHGAILVDANELNWGMKRDPQPEPRICDVDSWQVGTRWPARVIMPSIRDYHNKTFDEKSDWFSWGIVSFQVFTGIHPYKGRHDGYKQGELERRMRDNVSVFNKDVRLNAAVRPFDAIPGPLLDWYQRVFEQGERSIPPSPLDKAGTATTVRQVRAVVTATGSLVFEMIVEHGSDPVVRVYPCGMVLRQSGVLQNLTTKRYTNTNFTAKAEITKTNSGYLIADQGKFFYMSEAGVVALPLMINAHSVVRSGNRMFAVTDQGLTELELMEMSNKSVLTTGNTWPTLHLSTEWFEGVGVQNSLGAKYLVIPFGDKSCAFTRAAELDDITVVTAKAGNRFVSVIGINSAGEYKKFEFSFNAEYTKYTVWVGTSDSPELNLAILPSGVCATVVQDGELVVFVPQNGKVTKVPDKKIATDMQLSTWGDRVVYLQNGDVSWVRMK